MEDNNRTNGPNKVAFNPFTTRWTYESRYGYSSNLNNVTTNKIPMSVATIRR
jgi:hypothetical protein